MAATAWVLYNRAIYKMGTGVINFGTGNFRLVLVGSAGNYATSTLSLLSQITDQVTEGNGYSSSGKALTGKAWTAGTSAGAIKLDFTGNPIWSASGGAIASVKAAVLLLSAATAGGCHLVAWSQLTTSPFSVTDGNTLTIAFHANGLFEFANA